MKKIQTDVYAKCTCGTGIYLEDEKTTECDCGRFWRLRILITEVVLKGKNDLHRRTISKTN